MSATKFRDFKHIVGKLEFLWADYYTKLFCFCVHGGAPDPNQTYTRTFPVQLNEISKCR